MRIAIFLAQAIDLAEISYMNRIGLTEHNPPLKIFHITYTFRYRDHFSKKILCDGF